MKTEQMMALYIGKVLKEKRHTLKLSRCDVAEKIGLSHQRIHKFENGHSCLSPFTLYQMCDILGVDTQSLFNGFDAFCSHYALSHGTQQCIGLDHDSPLNILLIDDDTEEELWTRQICETCEIPVHILKLHDKVSAYAFLKNETTSGAFLRPDIILLDINDPLTSFLKEIKRDRALCDIPIILLSNVIDAQDIMQAYQRYASGVIIKSLDFKTYSDTLKSVVHYWAKTVALPKRLYDKD